MNAPVWKLPRSIAVSLSFLFGFSAAVRSAPAAAPAKVVKTAGELPSLPPDQPVSGWRGESGTCSLPPLFLPRTPRRR
jgi:hypothetical protein